MSLGTDNACRKRRKPQEAARHPRPAAPRGTVTFLFTDIEGSTRLLARVRDGFADVLEAHHRVLRAAFAQHGGHEVHTEGDAFFVAFARATEAIAAAVAAQRALAVHPWPEGVDLRVRMGLHTGEAAVRADDYVGMDVHRAARICSAAHGGQVLVSSATRELVVAELDAGVALDDVGEHRLKDLERPERLYQVVADELAAKFPPPRSEAQANGASRLPPAPNRTIGREADVRAIAGRIRSARTGCCAIGTPRPRTGSTGRWACPAPRPISCSAPARCASRAGRSGRSGARLTTPRS